MPRESIPPEIPCGSPDCLRLLSWNVHGLPGMSDTPARLRRIAGLVRQQAPDLVLLQEIWLGRYRELLVDALGEIYEAVDEPRPPFAWPRGGLVVLLRRGGAWRRGSHRFHAFARSAPWYRLSEGDALGGKGFLAVELERATGGEDGAWPRRLTVVDTHLQSQYGVRLYEPVRRAQLEQLESWLRSLDARGTPAIVAGDLNTSADEELHASHVARLGADLFAPERQRSGCGSHFDDQGGHSGWIDYVLARNWKPEVAVHRFENQAADRPYSDHDGLLVRLAVPAGSQDSLPDPGR